MKMNTKKLVTLAMMAAIAFVLTALIKIPLAPAAPYLTYDPKDIILVIAGFIFGPLEALIVTVVVSLIEMVTVGTTGIIGFIMNVLASVAFAVTAALIYKKWHTIRGAIIGLICGVLAMTAIMLLWNYLITPIYTGYDRNLIAGMLVPVYLPFNMIKSGINAAITMMLYKPIVTVLRKANLITEATTHEKSKNSIIVMIVSAIILISLIVTVLVEFKMI